MLNYQEARARLVDHDHGVLATVHPERGVDAVPVVYALDDQDFLAIPVDRVKPKGSTRLQRQRNLEADPRATLLIEQWDKADWSQLWWVRAELRWHGEGRVGDHQALASALVQRYPQYESTQHESEPSADQPFAHLLILRVVGLTGWAASA